MPLAVAELDAPPTSAASARLVSVGYGYIGLNNFRVFITNGDFVPVDNDFVFMVTGR